MDGAKILNQIERNRGRGADLVEKLQIEREAETSSRMVMGAQDFSSRGLVPNQNNFN